MLNYQRVVGDEFPDIIPSLWCLGSVSILYSYIIEGSLEVKLPTIWRDEKQSREEA